MTDFPVSPNTAQPTGGDNPPPVPQILQQPLPAQPPAAWSLPQPAAGEPVFAPPPPPPPEPQPDPNRPLWQAVIGPMTEEEWRQTRPRRLVSVSWCYALTAMLFLYLGASAFESAAVPFFGLTVPRALLFIPAHLLLLAVSLCAFFKNVSLLLWRERHAWEAYQATEMSGRLVTVYADRITAQGETDTVVVPLSGAVIREYPALLTVTNGGRTVTVRGEDLYPAEAAVLSDLLVPAASARYGRFPMAGFKPAGAGRPVPRSREPKPLLTAPFTLSRAAAFSTRVSAFFREQWLVWAPLMSLSALMLTDCLPQNNYFWLFYLIIFLSVNILSLLIPIFGLFWSVKTDRTLPKSGEWRFYPDRLTVVTPEEIREYPRHQVYLTADGRDVWLRQTGVTEAWPQSAFADYPALAEFLGLPRR